jgi:flagellar motor switch/type III secretory pathway protein FliN
MFTDAEPLRVEVGRTLLWPGEVPELTVGSTVELDTRGEQDVQVYFDNRLIALGNAVVVGGKLGVEVSELALEGVEDGKNK